MFTTHGYTLTKLPVNLEDLSTSLGLKNLKLTKNERNGILASIDIDKHLADFQNSQVD